MKVSIHFRRMDVWSVMNNRTHGRETDEFLSRMILVGADSND